MYGLQKVKGLQSVDNHTVATLAYTAGIIDGEGCIGIYKEGRKGRWIYYVLAVNVGNTNPQLIEYLYSNFGGQSWKSPRLPPRKTAYCWRLQAKSAGEFLKLIFPYLLLKKPQAELALKFQARRRIPGVKGLSVEKKVLDKADCALMHSYNQRGVK